LVYAFNDSHHVACEANTVSSIWTGGTSFTLLAYFDVNHVNLPYALNNLDGVAGTVQTIGLEYHAMWWPSGAAAPILLDSRDSEGLGLNNTGSFVGTAFGDDDVQHATAWANVIFGIAPRTLNNEHLVNSAAIAINDTGTAVGRVGSKPTEWASSGVQTNLPLLFGGSTGAAYSINAQGDAVGKSTTKLVTFIGTTIVPVATVWKDGSVTDLNLVTNLPDSWNLTEAHSINDVGQITALATDPTGYTHAVLLTPFSNQAPIAKCAAATVNANAICQAAASIDNGSSDADSASFSLAQLPPSPYGLGSTLVKLTATDSDGASASCSADVTVQDTTKPVVSCPATSSASAGASCKAVIPNVLADVTASDNCGASASLTKAQDIAAGTLVGLGSTSINVSVTDASSNTGTCTTAFTVVDTSVPTLSATLTQPILWTPSHELVNVGFAVSVSDNCDTAPPAQVMVYSNEPDRPAGDADASFSPDARNVASGSLRLRAERLQAGSGRVYLVTAQATDSANNTSVSCATVVVPHDQNTKSLAVVSSLATVAQTYCASHNGAAPTGYVAVGAGAVVGPKQ